MMDQGILKNIFLTSSYQIPKNFPNKLKTIVKYLFRTENFVDPSFETIMPLFKTDGTIVSAYHHVYIKDKQRTFSSSTNTRMGNCNTPPR